MLIFPTNLEEVEEVCGGSAYGNEVLVLFRYGIWKVDYLELLRSLRFR